MKPSRNVLVVDDEEDVRWALKMILARSGFVVATASSGAEALCWLKDHPCDLILLDAKLGDIEGVELARRIRSETDNHAPVILVSGYFYKDDSLIQDSLTIGLIAAFVTKPFRHDEIRDTVRSVLAAA
ncbi:MAG: response regulator [Comamonadaceae bacterium]